MRVDPKRNRQRALNGGIAGQQKVKRLKGRVEAKETASATLNRRSLVIREEIAPGIIGKVTIQRDSLAPEQLASLEGSIKRSEVTLIEQLPEPTACLELLSRDWRDCRRHAQRIGAKVWLVQTIGESGAGGIDSGRGSCLLYAAFHGTPEQLNSLRVQEWCQAVVLATDATDRQPLTLAPMPRAKGLSFLESDRKERAARACSRPMATAESAREPCYRPMSTGADRLYVEPIGWIDCRFAGDHWIAKRG